jgi:hypothetical protein
MTDLACACEGADADENVADPTEACDDLAYPPRGIMVCRRHGVDPCHDDGWHTPR